MADYDFKTLSPTDFEYFVCDLINTEFGLKLHSYPAGRDQGVDLRQVDTQDKITVVQCKHYAGSTWSDFRKSALKEAVKPGARGADRYMIATSLPLTALNHTKIVKELRSLGIALAHDDVLGARALNDALMNHPEVERRHIKLWLSSSTVVEDLINSGRWRRTEALLEETLDRARFWVEPPAYAEVFHVLREEGVCVVAGAPGAGKTFLAEMVALAASREGWEVVHVSNSIEAWDLLRKDDTPRLFYYDDFLGQAELKITATEEGPHLESFIARVRKLKKHKRLIMTTREQVLRQASLANSESLSRVTSAPIPYLIALSTYDVKTRAEILFNHLYFSSLSNVDRRQLAIDNRIISLVQHPSYNPRVVATVAQRATISTSADTLLAQLSQILDDPHELLKVSFQALKAPAKELLLTLATFPARPIRLEELKKICGQDVTSLEWKEIWQALEPAWVRLAISSLEKSLAFANPGCRDFLLNLLDDIDLAGERIDHIQRFEQITALTQAAGLLRGVPNSHRFQRAELAYALTSRRDEIARLIGKVIQRELSAAITEASSARLLSEVAALAAIYGSIDSTRWLWNQISNINSAQRFMPVIDGLSLAVRLLDVPREDELEANLQIKSLVRSAVTNIATLRDLDAYESLPSDLHDAEIHDVARNKAALVITLELEQLIESTTSADMLREALIDLQERAEWYGHSLSFDAYFDRVDELEINSGDYTNWPEKPPASSLKRETVAQIRHIFSRLDDSTD
ncbi:nSTAND3 domain-containing NTPase [Streptosporangium jomthongense]